jgi:hypothetical protein
MAYPEYLLEDFAFLKKCGFPDLLRDFVLMGFTKARIKANKPTKPDLFYINFT